MNHKKIKAGIIGGAGYTGGEMIRLLLNHPDVDVEFVHSRSNAGIPVSSVHHDLEGDTMLSFTDTIKTGIDVLFLCLGHEESKVFLLENSFDEHIVIIDLSQDFRLQAGHTIGDRQFVYGLPEANREVIKTAKSIANPGCFATAIQLALLPLAMEGLLSEVHVTGITGATGAGQKLQQSSHFAWRTNNIQAYKALAHQHVHEIVETLNTFQPGFTQLHFIPWRGDFTRGIYLTAQIVCNSSLADLNALYKNRYEAHPFTHVSDTMIDMKQVVNTNKCFIHLEQVENNLLVHATIDNLLKGASGQAVQNMNLVFGLPEDAGLKLKASSF